MCSRYIPDSHDYTNDAHRRYINLSSYLVCWKQLENKIRRVIINFSVLEKVLFN